MQTKKRIISVLLAFFMSAVLLPLLFAAPAKAATTVDVGGGTYRALMDAASNADASTTLRLTKDISITTNNNVWLQGRSFTLDLNGHSITSTQNDALYIITSSNVRIINSSSTRATITGASGGGLDVQGSSVVRIEGAITFNKVYVDNTSRVYVDDPQVTFSSYYNNATKNRISYYQYSVSSWAELKHAAALAPKDGTAATITLTADIPAASEFLSINGGHNLTLDLNGHNITSTQANSAIYSSGTFTLTVKNSSSTRSAIKGTVTSATNAGMGAIWGYGNGSFHIQDNVTLNGIYGATFYIDGPNVVIDNFFGNSESCTYYKVSYNANGGTNAPAANYKRRTANLALSSTAPTRSGYTLKAWNTAANGTGTNYGFTYNTNAVTTLYAQWSQNQNLTYNANGHGTAPNAVTMTYNTATNAAAAISATGYTFTGWNTTANGSGTKYTAGQQVKAANIDPAAATLYAQWTPNTYTVTLDGQDAAAAGTASVTATYDAAMPSVTVPSKTGCIFNGYYDAVSGGTQYYDAGGVGTRNWDKANNTTLYAQWSAATNLTPELSGGDITLGFSTTASAYAEELGYTAGNTLSFVICDKNGSVRKSEVISSPDTQTGLSFSVNPAEIFTEFTVKLVNESNSASYTINASISMADYCNEMKKTGDAELTALCDSILDYGSVAQGIFFDGEVIDVSLPEASGTDVPEEAVLTQENFPKIKADMSFFVLENAKVRLYFDSEISGDDVEITSTFGTVRYGCVASNDEEHDYHYAEIENIKPSDLGKQFSVTIRLNGDEVGTTYTYSALQCVYDIMTACRGQDYNPAELLYPSLVNYYLAAKAYFTSD